MVYGPRREQELSIPYALDGLVVPGVRPRPGRDGYGDDELALAGHLQGLLRGLFLRFAAGDQGALTAATPAHLRSRIELTATEQAVLVLLADGHTTYAIALRLEMAPRTASKHLEHIYRKLDVTHRMAAVNAAREAGLVGSRRDAAHAP